MEITREVVTDLLPICFSDEASRDTKALVEEYFRDNPDFERMARSAGTPLDTLRTAQPLAAGSEKEKRDLESVRCGLDRRKWLFGVSLFLTLSPLSLYFTHGNLFSLMVGDGLWEAALPGPWRRSSGSYVSRSRAVARRPSWLRFFLR